MFCEANEVLLLRKMTARHAAPVNQSLPVVRYAKFAGEEMGSCNYNPLFHKDMYIQIFIATLKASNKIKTIQP